MSGPLIMDQNPNWMIAEYDERVSSKWNCAQIVPVKVKSFQIVPNETKNTMKN